MPPPNLQLPAVIDAYIAMEWFELEGGRIAQRWGARDSGGITRQVVG